MTIKTSGPLGFNEINAEFGRGTNLSAYRGTQWWTDAGASGNFNVNSISFQEFYGKSNSPRWTFIGDLYYDGLFSTRYGGFINNGGFGPTLFVGPHHCYGVYEDFAAIEFDSTVRGSYVSFPDGRPSTFCRINVRGITDQTSSNYDGRAFRFNNTGTFWVNQTRTTEIYLFN